jgi:hypothetical protein
MGASVRRILTDSACRRSPAALVGAVLISALLVPASASGHAPQHPDPLRFVSPEVRANYENMDNEVALTRAAMEQDSYVARVTGLIRIGGRTVPATPALPVPTAQQLASVVALPVPLRSPVAGLLAAVVEAKRMIGLVPIRSVARGLQSLLRPRPPVSSKAARQLGSPMKKTPDDILRFQRKLQELGSPRPPVIKKPSPAIRARRVRSETAALLVASALDTYVPQLESFDQPWRAGQVAGGCDAQDATPLLCVGSDAKNTYEANEILLIDMGGDDTYKNSAGASFTAADKAPVSTSINIDLAGNDTYASDPNIANGFFPDETTGLGIHNGNFTAAQGVGLYGLGTLVDRGGDDSYLVTAHPTTIERYGSTAWGQGTAAGGGVGLLFDEGGKDSYRMVGLEGQANSVLLEAQASSEGGDAALIDAGLDDDLYSVDPGAVVQTLDKPDVRSLRTTRVQAYSVLGHSVLHDEGGKDRFELKISSHFDPTIDDYTRVNPPWFDTKAQAVAISISRTYAFLMTGLDDTVYSIDLDLTGPTWSPLEGQARAMGIGDAGAVIDDAGGNDLYHVNHQVVFDRVFDQTDACLCDAAEAVVDTLWAGFQHMTMVQAQWDNVGDGTAMITDGGGSDTYDVNHIVDLSFTLHDALSHPKYPALFRMFGFPVGGIFAQGLLSAGGRILDQGNGTDSYSIDNVLNVSTGVRSDNTKLHPDVRSYSTPVLLFGQNGIVDEGGENDSMRVAVEINNSTWPDPAGSIEYGSGLWPNAQTSVYAAGVDPVITRSTSFPSCGDPGYHGFGQWRSCQSNKADPDHDAMNGQSDAGAGYAPLAEAAKPELEILPGVPDAMQSDAHEITRFPMAARLTAPDGKPLAKTPVHFDLMMRTIQASALGEQEATTQAWYSLYQEQGVTNRKGIAKAALPLMLLLRTGDDLIPDPANRFRVEVTYDGSDDLYPRHVAKDIDILPPSPNSRAFKRPL